MELEQKEVLRLVQEGKISAAEAQKLLSAMEATADGEMVPVEAAPEPLPPTEPRPRTRRTHHWAYVALFGAGWTLMGVALTLWLKDTFWLILAIPFLLLGILVALLGVWSRGAPWFSLRITDSATGRRKMGFDFPLPLGLAAWGVRMARPFVPQFRDTAIDELILAMREGTTEDEILLVDVVDGEDGERVQIHLG